MIVLEWTSSADEFCQPEVAFWYDGRVGSIFVGERRPGGSSFGDIGDELCGWCIFPVSCVAVALCEIDGHVGVVGGW